MTLKEGFRPAVTYAVSPLLVDTATRRPTIERAISPTCATWGAELQVGSQLAGGMLLTQLISHEHQLGAHICRRQPGTENRSKVAMNNLGSQHWVGCCF